MAIEFELKFRAEPHILETIRQETSGEEQLWQMETTYYDTPSGALSRRHCTLRRRMENSRSVCTLKTPAEGMGRNEFEAEAPSVQDALGTLCKLCDLKELPELLKEGVVPVCGARFTRIAKTVKTDICTLELALDRGVLTGGGRELPLCEVEVELKAGPRQGAYDYALQLAAAYGLAPEKLSKFRRAQLLAAGGLQDG